MSNQEPQDPNKTTEETAVENRRRFIKGAGVAVPVVLSLTSSSVFGADGQACYSQQLSGNLMSGKTLGCSKGYAPSFWRDPANRSRWPSIPVPPGAGSSRYNYGTASGNPPNPNPTGCGAFVIASGTKFNDPVLGFVGVGSNAGTLTGTTASMRAALCSGTAATFPQDSAVWVTALLNSLYVPNYIFRYAQLMAFFNTPDPNDIPKDYSSKVAYLKSTWVGV